MRTKTKQISFLHFSSSGIGSMHPFSFIVIVVAASAAAVHGHSAVNTPAAQFWEQALPVTPMPNALADLVQKGMDQSLLGYQHHDAVSSFSSISACVTLFDYTCDARQVTETGVYFAEPQLRPGNTMTLTLPAEAAPAILPRDVAEKVPFGNLDDVLAAFDIPVGSPEAAQVGHTLIRCQTPPATGEVKSCTTSLEATVQSAMNMLGSTTGRDEDVWVAASEISSAGLLRQPYVVQAVTPIQGSRYVPCHPMPFPYTVFQCHVARAEGYRAHKVSLRGVHDGSTVAMLAFCHLDTSGWNPTHPVFKLLQTRPGVGPVCHFMPYGNLAFVKMATTASA